MKKILLFLLIISLSFSLGSAVSNAQSDQCTPQNIPKLDRLAVEQCQAQISKALELSVNATKPSQTQLNLLKTQIKAIKDRVGAIEYELSLKKANIEKGYAQLAKQKNTLNKTISNYYIKSYYNSPFIVFMANPKSAVGVIQNLAFQRALASQDREKIVNFALLLIDLENQKKNLETEETQLTALKANLDEQSAKLDKLVQGALAYQASLGSLLSQLSARQREILGQRLSALGIPLFASMGGGCSSDIGKDPGFSNGFGLFTYGVPNRVGLNQYGAWGRAKAGQNSETILRAYYSFDSITGADQNIQIHIQGNGIDETRSLEEYVKRIYEVPDSWTDNDSSALKAQAIAVRSYVLAYTNNGQGSICPTDQCQVYQSNPKGGNWESAVNATAGQVMVQGASPIKAWFSSTHGGYTHSSGDIGWNSTSWTKNAQDTTSSVASFADLQNNAYDKDSKWFYCDWGGRGQNNTAWLRSEEFADIVNVIMLVQATGGDQETTKHLYQTDKPNPAGTDTWDAGRVKSELVKLGGTPFDFVSSASVTSVDFGAGKTSTVTVNGRGFPGDLFKTYFNLRAPANIQIVGPLYNIEPVH